MAGWSALPIRDRRLLEWLWGGDVVTADLAALLAYGGRRVAQRRLGRLVAYGILRGFWAANMQRPRGRYAYALTKAARRELEHLIWGDDARAAAQAKLYAPSPVIHQLATHDLFAAFLRASPAAAEVGLAGWVPERAAARTYRDYVRPDAIAIFRDRDRSTVLLIERDLGTERRDVLGGKIDRYRTATVQFGHRQAGVGIVVESARRAAAIRSSLKHRQERLERDYQKSFAFPTWVAVTDEVVADPYGAIWQSPMGDEATVLTMPPCELYYPLPILTSPALTQVGALGSLDDRVLAAIDWRD
jgi:hypothetical protein